MNSQLITVLILLSICLLNSCQPDRGNRVQINTTLENIDCYKNLVANIVSDSNSREKITEIRKSKSKGKNEVVTCNPNLRLIEIEELNNLIAKIWIQNCKEGLQNGNDIFGIRYLNKDQIIIEVDRMWRPHYLSSTKKIEIHRLYFGRIPVDNSYRYGPEEIINTIEIEEDWIYQISQFVAVYGDFG